MYCSYCGKQNQHENARFCSYCGKPLALEELIDEAEREAAASNHPGTQLDTAVQSGEQFAASMSQLAWDTPPVEPAGEQPTTLAAPYSPATELEDDAYGEQEHAQPIPVPATKKSGQGIRVFAWAVPLLLAIIAGGGVYGYYTYEEMQNDRVLSWHKEAERQALLGSYDKAFVLLDKALAVRPDYNALQADRAIVLQAAALQRSLAEAGDQLGKRHLKEAGEALDAAEEELGEHAEKLFEPLHASLGEQRVKLTVLTIKGELDQLNTVDELIAKLRIADGLESKEADAVRSQIVGKIAELSLKDGERLLQKKSFSDAAAAVEVGLEYAGDNEKLQALKERIAKEKKAYEDAEQQRIEQARQKAAEEDLKNRTAAIEAVAVSSTLDEYGDLSIHAELRNVATKTIYSVYIEYTLLDGAGNTIGTGAAYATPDVLEPGDTAVVDDIYYGAYAKAEVRIDRATWYLD